MNTQNFRIERINLIRKFFIIKLLRLILYIVVFFCSSQLFGADVSVNPACRDITVVGDSYVAVGTFGKIDLISKSGEVTNLTSNTTINLNAVFYADNKIIAVGDSGIILLSEDIATFKIIYGETKEKINDIIYFNNKFILATNNGELLVSQNLKNWQKISLPVGGNIVSLSADAESCFGVTDVGEIIRTSDAEGWDVFDFNEQYRGYIKPSFFRKVLITKNWIVIVGQHEDDSPAVMFSSDGNVWIERSLNYIDDNGIPKVFTAIPNDVSYASENDKFYIACDNGDISVLSSCSKCNKTYHIADKNLYSVLMKDNILAVVGEGFYVKIIN